MSDVEATNPQAEVGDVLSRLKEKLSGQAEAERRPAPAPKPESTQVAEPDEPEESELEAEEVEDDEPATAEHEAPEHDEGDDEGEEPETDNLAEIELPGGKKAKIPADLYEQIKPAIMMQADYTRKTQELAEVRKSAESETAQARQQRQQYEQGLQLAQMVVQTFAPQPPPDSLLEEDPYEYQRQSLKFQRAMETWKATQIEAARVQKHQSEEMQRSHEKAMQEGARRLNEIISDWKDPSRRTKESREVWEFATKHPVASYPAEALAASPNPNDFYHLRNSMLYERLMAKKASAKPVAPVTQKPGPSRKPSQDSAAVRSRRKLKQTGRIDDGFAAFKAKLSRMRS